MKYDSLVRQLHNVTLECGTWPALALEQNNDVIDLRIFHDAFKNSDNLLEDQSGVFQKKKEAVAFDLDACSAKLVSFRRFCVSSGRGVLTSQNISVTRELAK